MFFRIFIQPVFGLGVKGLISYLNEYLENKTACLAPIIVFEIFIYLFFNILSAIYVHYFLYYLFYVAYV